MSQSNITNLPAWAASRVHAALATERPHFFEVEYNHARIKSRNPWTNQKKTDMQHRFGTIYPNGIVTLDSGVMFASLAQLRDHFEEQGSYLLLDEQGNTL